MTRTHLSGSRKGPRMSMAELEESLPAGPRMSLAEIEALLGKDRIAELDKLLLPSPFMRIQTLNRALQNLRNKRDNDYDKVFKLAVEAMDTMPDLNGQSLSHQERQYVNSHFTGIATTACSLALETGKSAEVALDLLERGRGVIIRLLMDEGSDTSRLKIDDYDLWQRYTALSTSVVASRYTEAMATALNVKAADQKDVEELDDCIQAIRQIHGLEGFRTDITPDQMKICARNGAIVVVNVTTLRSDALIVTSDKIRFVKLHNLNAQQAGEWLTQDLITPSLDIERGRQNKAYVQFLSWLWDSCVKGVLDELGYKAQPRMEDLPRVWWIGTGLANSFPFHAAGEGGLGHDANACYRVVSSYTPTIEALKYTKDRLKNPDASKEIRNVMIVSMPETPRGPLGGNLDDLNTEGEIAAIQEAFEGIATVNSLVRPTSMAVLQGLYFCNIAHFACHGISHPEDPSRSGLILQGSMDDSLPTQAPTQHPLSLLVILAAKFRHVEIAYLSACSTAQNSAKSLVDEVLHLVGGFQVAGFRHTIGCLWESNDQVCVKVATSFYQSIAKCGPNAYDDDFVALALHKAVLAVREDKPKQPLLWAQYVHFGA